MRLCKASSGIPFFFIILGLSPITLAQNTKALTESGTIIGVREDGLSAYKGVPLASPLSANCAGGQRLLSGTVHPVIEPYVLPALPYETFAAGQQNAGQQNDAKAGAQGTLPNSGMPSTIWTKSRGAGAKRIRRDPVIVGGVASIDGLRVFDAVYSSVRGKPFAISATR